MANCFVVFNYPHGKFVEGVIRLLFCVKFLAYCGFPDIYTGGIIEGLSVYNHTMSRPGSGPDSSQFSFDFSMPKEFQLYGVF